MRGEFIRLKELDYVKSAKLMGAGKMRIMFVHILPNAMPALLSAITVGFNNAVLAEAGMSYLGIGVQPPDASLGKMLSEAQSFLFSAPWYVIFPGIVIILLILGFINIAPSMQADSESTTEQCVPLQLTKNHFPLCRVTL